MFFAAFWTPILKNLEKHDEKHSEMMKKYKNPMFLNLFI